MVLRVLAAHRFYLSNPVVWAATITMVASATLSAMAQQTVINREDTRKRKIRRITETRHSFVDGHAAEKGRPWSFREYDRRGNQIITGRIMSDGRDSSMYVREYDAEDRPVKRTWYCERTDEHPRGKPCLVFRDYRFDQYGNVSEEVGYELDGTFKAKVIFKRDSAGRPLAREDFFGKNLPKNRRYRYTYNEQGDAVETLTFDGNGILIVTRRTQYMYDEKGRIATWKTTDDKGKVVDNGRHRYDDQGNRIETLEFGAAQPARLRKFTYDYWG